MRKVEVFHSMIYYDNLYPEANDPPKEDEHGLHVCCS